MPIPGASRRAEHVRPILDGATCQRGPAGGTCLLGCARRGNSSAGQHLDVTLCHRGRPPIPLIECCRIHPEWRLTAPAWRRRQKVTRNAAAEYPRAVHEPQSPGSAGVPQRADRGQSPALAHRVTVLGSTRNIVATSAGVNSGSASGVRADMCVASPPGPVLRSCVSYVAWWLRGEPVGDVLYGRQRPYCHHQR